MSLKKNNDPVAIGFFFYLVFILVAMLLHLANCAVK